MQFFTKDIPTSIDAVQSMTKCENYWLHVHQCMNKIATVLCVLHQEHNTTNSMYKRGRWKAYPITMNLKARFTMEAMTEINIITID